MLALSRGAVRCETMRALRSFSAVAFPPLHVRMRPTGSSGSRKSRYLRENDEIPGVVYGVDDDRNVLKTMIVVNRKTLMAELKNRGNSFENTVFELNVESPEGNSKHLVTARQTQFCALTGKPLSVNFLRYLPGNRLRIPLDFVNSDQSIDLRRGCFIVRVNKSVECVCDNEVPARIEVDLSGAQKGDVFRLNTLKFPPHVRPALNVPPDFVACVVKSARASK